MRKVIQDINNKKNLEMNLPVYANYLADIYSRSAAVELTMDYYTLSEMLADNQNIDNQVKELTSQFNDILFNSVINSKVDADREKAISSIDKLRNKVFKKVDVLAAYADVFSRYEYVSNRCEYLFRENGLGDDYSDEEFTKSVMQYIFSDEDNTAINSKISDIVAELPLRMTKSKFFELLNSGIDVYKKTDKETIDDFIYVLKTSSMQSVPENLSEYDNLFEIYNSVKCLDFSSITKGDFLQLEKKLELASSVITKETDIYMLLQGIINRAYVMILNAPYALNESSDIECCMKIITAIYDNMKDGEYRTLDDSVADLFVNLEGVPESLHSKISAVEYILDEIRKNDLDIIKSLMLENIYQALFYSTELLSDSLFINLHDAFSLANDQSTQDKEFILDDYIENAKNDFINELTVYFKDNQKIVNRSVMAVILSRIPVFFNNVSEIQDYIYNSLSNCTNMAEKKASVEIIKCIINEI